jgi:predicted DNA-binding transcriptional regulator YafY
MFLRVADTRELLDSILSFGSGVRVLAPGSLREKIQSEEDFDSGCHCPMIDTEIQ